LLCPFLNSIAPLLTAVEVWKRTLPPNHKIIRDKGEKSEKPNKTLISDICSFGIGMKGGYSK